MDEVVRQIVKSSFIILCLLIASKSEAQDFQVEGATAIQKLDASSGYNNDNVVYPAFGIGYQVTEHHSFWLTFVSISGQPPSESSPGPPRPGGNQIHIQAYPIGFQYRYRLFNKEVMIIPYVKASLLLIPIKDKVKSDTPTRTSHSTNLGGNFGIGIKVPLINRFSLFGAANYRLIKNSDHRSPQHVNLDGLWGQLGITIRL